MTQEECQKKYRELFPDDKAKAEAFDMLADRFYNMNFGTLSKTDAEVLMFSLYLDRILNETEEDIWTYDDYTLSKYLGVTQSKISSLKVKKELLYPFKGFQWQKSFARIMERAEYENGKIKIMIPDKNLYLELKHAVEKSGSYVDVSLTANLLQISPAAFVDLVMEATGESDRAALRKTIKKQLSKTQTAEDADYFERESLAALAKNKAGGLAVDAVCDIIKVIIPQSGVFVEGLRYIINKISEAAK